MKILKHGHNFNPYGLKMVYGIPYTREETITYFRTIHITAEELSDLNEWIKEGNSFYSNPWLVYNKKGTISNFIEGSRAIKDLYEEHLDELLIPSTPITDSAFIYNDLPF